MKEIWKPVSGYENYMEVSNIGRCRSVKRQLYRKGSVKVKAGYKYWNYGGKMRKPIDSQGRLKMNMRCKGLPDKQYPLSHLVARTFFEIPLNMRISKVDYIDGDYKNCRIDNLIVTITGQREKIRSDENGRT